jgi:hypothetical protein
MSLPFNPSDQWDRIINKIGSPQDHVLTKEQYALVNAYITEREFIILANFYQFLAQLATDPNNFHVLLKFIQISKVGAILLQHKQLNLNTLIQMLQEQSKMYISVIQALAQITQVTPNFNPFNIEGNLKWSAVFATLTTALALIGSEIGNIKNNIRNQISIDPFCIYPCSPRPPSPLKTSNVEMQHEPALAKLLLEFNDKEKLILELSKDKRNATTMGTEPKNSNRSRNSGSLQHERRL